MDRVRSAVQITPRFPCHRFLGGLLGSRARQFETTNFTSTLYRALSGRLDPGVKAARINANLTSDTREVLSGIVHGFGLAVPGNADPQLLIAFLEGDGCSSRRELKAFPGETFSNPGLIPRAQGQAMKRLYEAFTMFLMTLGAPLARRRDRRAAVGMGASAERPLDGRTGGE